MMSTDNKEKTFVQSGLVLTTDDALNSAIVQKVKLFTRTGGVLPPLKTSVGPGVGPMVGSTLEEGGLLP